MLRTLGELELAELEPGKRVRQVKPLLLLAYLALEGPTPRRRLAELLWPRARQPDASLRVALHTLRENAPGAVAGSDPLEPGLACDAATLLTLDGEGVLAAYRGPFLPALDTADTSPELEEWVVAQRERLARHVQGAALALAERSDPARAAALAEQVYRLPGAPPPEPGTLRRLLALTPPGSPLEAELRAELQDFAPEAGPDPTTPRPPARLLGRAAELDALLAWAAGGAADSGLKPVGAPLAWLSGPGGIGKSTLAREVLREARELGLSVALIDAEGVRQGAELLPRLAAALDPGRAAPGQWAGLHAALGPRPLVLLDGVDELADPAGLLGTLTRELPGVRWLLTARRGPPGARTGAGAVGLHLRLDGLELPPPGAAGAELAAASAVQLFVREARRYRRDFAVTPGAAPLVASLTRRLQGHPLALALAASWLRVEDLEAVHARILEQAALRGEREDGLHRGLDLVAARSWSLLSDSQRLTLLRLSVFADVEPADAPALGLPDADLDELLDHGFLETYRPGSERLRVSPALAATVQAQARAHPDVSAQARADHTRHYLAWFADQPPHAPAADLERPNVLLAARHALESAALPAGLPEKLLAHHIHRGLAATGTDTFAELADLADEHGAPDDLQASLQIACMWLAYLSDRLLDAQTLAQVFLSGPLAASAPHRMQALNTLASVRSSQGQHRVAADLSRETRRLAQELGDHVRQAMYGSNLLLHLTHLGEVEEARGLVASLHGLEGQLPPLLALDLRLRLISEQLRLPDPDPTRLLPEAQEVLEAVTAAAPDGQLALRAHLTTAQALLAANQPRRALQEARLVLSQEGATEAPMLMRSAKLLEVRALYLLGRAQQARVAAVSALERALIVRNQYDLVEGILTLAHDYQETSGQSLSAQLRAVATDQVLPNIQRRWAAHLLGTEEKLLNAESPTWSPEAVARQLLAWLTQLTPGAASDAK